MSAAPVPDGPPATLSRRHAAGAESAACCCPCSAKVAFEGRLEIDVFGIRGRAALALVDTLEATPPRFDGPPLPSEIHNLPLGVVTIIVPFNWPIAILAAPGEPIYVDVYRPDSGAPAAPIIGTRDLLSGTSSDREAVATGADRVRARRHRCPVRRHPRPARRPAPG